jgi:tol-pal system protein YbgF
MRRVLALGVVLLGIGAAPASAADREHEQVIADIRMLEAQVLQNQRMLSALHDAIEGLTAILASHGDEMRRAFADQQLATGSIATGVRVVREKIDESNVRVASLSQEVEALRLAIPPLPPAMTSLADPDTGLPVDPPPAVLAPAPLPAGISPQRMYDTAWADYTNGQWTLAIQGFEAYIQTFPRSELTDDAAFYVGQTHFAEGRFPEAVEAFEAVLRDYPAGDVVPEAWYKLGLALDRLGETDRAREAFEGVVSDHPESNMAALAQQALDRLDRPAR